MTLIPTAFSNYNLWYPHDTVIHTHAGSTEVAMCSCTIPVPYHGLGVQRDNDAKLLGHTVKEVAGYPQLITHRDSLTRPHLELPLQKAICCISFNTKINIKKTFFPTYYLKWIFTPVIRTYSHTLTPHFFPQGSFFTFTPKGNP